jgi:8-oxo-dGTP pyrophosphatase MutT (NUDIX family)
MNNTHLSDWGKVIPTVECLITYKDEVLLQKRSPLSKKFPNYYIGPGGHVDSTEDFLTAAIRETKEETGVDVKESEIKLRCVAIGRHEDRQEVYMALFFLVKLSKKPSIKSSDEGTNEWLPIDKVTKLENIFPPFAYYIKHALSNNIGVMYTNLKFKELQLIEESSVKIDQDY